MMAMMIWVMALCGYVDRGPPRRSRRAIIKGPHLRRACEVWVGTQERRRKRRERGGVEVQAHIDVGPIIPVPERGRVVITRRRDELIYTEVRYSRAAFPDLAKVEAV